jgi:hypothetical protein
MSDPTFGALCALASALSWSVVSLLARSLIPHYGSVTINAVRSGVAGVLLVAVVILFDGAHTLFAMSRATFVQLTVSIVAAIGIGDTVFLREHAGHRPQPGHDHRHDLPGGRRAAGRRLPGRAAHDPRSSWVAAHAGLASR